MKALVWAAFWYNVIQTNDTFLFIILALYLILYD